MRAALRQRSDLAATRYPKGALLKKSVSHRDRRGARPDFFSKPLECVSHEVSFLTMRWGVAGSSLLRVLFVIYCVEAGLFLVIAPWREFWNLLVTRSALSHAHLGAFLLLPWVRGAVTGFGLVHLIWGIHDLERILLSRRPRNPASPVPEPDRAG